MIDHLEGGKRIKKGAKWSEHMHVFRARARA